MLAEAATTAVFTLAPLPLVLAEAAATAVFAPAPYPLVFAEAAAAAVFAPALLGAYCHGFESVPLARVS